MSEQVLSSAKANFKLTLLNAEVQSILSSDLYLWLTESGLPSEVAIRLKELVQLTKKVGDKVIEIGKIILVKIIEFVKTHPNLAIGIAVGAAVGALISTIPFLGAYLSPIATAISVSIGAIAGHRFDKIEQGQSVSTSTDIIAIGQDLIEIAKAFFKLLIDIFNIIFEKTSVCIGVIMSGHAKVTKEQLLKMIDNLEKNPDDKIRILGDTGITLVGAGLGVAAAGTLATATGVTSIAGLTTVASWLGVSAVAATPIGWILGTAAAGGALAYGVSRLIHDGGLAEGRKAELLQKYRESANDMESKERANSITDTDKATFIISTRELIDKDVISPEEAADLIEHVEKGRIPISQAYQLIQDLLEEKPVETSEN